MRIQNTKNIKEALELLENAMTLINDAYSIYDSDIGTSLDHYRTISDVVGSMEEDL